MKLIGMLILSVAFWGTLNGCGKASGEPSACKDSVNAPKFAQVNTTIVKTDCIGCHTNQNPTLRNFDEIKAHAQSILSEVRSGSMPKNAGKLSDAKIELLDQWIGCGMQP